MATYVSTMGPSDARVEMRRKTSADDAIMFYETVLDSNYGARVGAYRVEY